MAILHNRALVSTATTGTGTMTLGAPVSAGFFSFAEAGVTNGEVVPYVIEDGSNVELGIGTYSSTGPTLSRDTVRASRIGGTAGTTKLTLSGTATVYIDAMVEDIVPYSAGVLGRVVETVVTLTDGATPALNAALGNIFLLVAAGDRTIPVPSNPVSGQKIIIRHNASGAIRTLALNTGAGGFRFGTDITALSATASGKTDYIGAIYNSTAGFWDVVAYAKGY